MDLHEKVKRLRLEAGMTQSDLAGDRITRNMLSQIENGNATPSIQTLRYIAQRLNISPAYFLSDDDDDFIYKKSCIIPKITEKFKNKEYNTCIELCSAFVGREDDELNLILAECFFYAAADDFKSGRLISAHNGFITSQKYARRTAYTADWMISVSSSYLNFITTVNIKYDGIPADDPDIAALKKFASELPHLDMLFYYSALMLTEYGNTDTEKINKAEDLISAVEDGDYKKHIAARITADKGNRREALRLLSELNRDSALAMRYHVMRDLERLYTQSGDFENAYNIFGKRIELYTKMQE
ncbi:MAG: helix-turn-helix transcriptional regulator [Eubacteriales bacterium]|jgi:transcriptional regulator with XRE-family HTH domain|nr:helix-turn-helix transcriptional regulator [Eubacteriales bacterium]